MKVMYETVERGARSNEHNPIRPEATVTSATEPPELVSKAPRDATPAEQTTKSKGGMHNEVVSYFLHLGKNS